MTEKFNELLLQAQNEATAESKNYILARHLLEIKTCSRIPVGTWKELFRYAVKLDNETYNTIWDLYNRSIRANTKLAQLISFLPECQIEVEYQFADPTEEREEN